MRKKKKEEEGERERKREGERGKEYPRRRGSREGGEAGRLGRSIESQG